MTKVGRIIEEEKRQAIAKVEEKMAKVEAEKKQALAKAETDKKQALAEKQKALKAARKAKKRADLLQQAARDSVLKMIRKNYPTEEIASIVSVFSKDDIEAMRKEMTLF